ncbi:DUF1214 domain-containing protein [Cupriavidus taiwanensis]|uniref:DUF1214 domain-containing protein n=1 Tax=Cupriavidus taiwanensis TaxID=164546 RepID=UPI000E1B4841|nr:DUF1214 domain-containing protein [Cupriavidus taiwanensis]SOY71012.1 conserved hypothetical protein [Cupriavidus taiwanensis]
MQQFTRPGQWRGRRGWWMMAGLRFRPVPTRPDPIHQRRREGGGQYQRGVSGGGRAAGRIAWPDDFVQIGRAINLIHFSPPLCDSLAFAATLLNRDTRYSSGVFDLDAGPVTITMPDPGKRFMALQVINEDHYVPNVFYGKGTYTLTRENVGTRYVAAAIRTLVDPNSADDIRQVHVLQDAIKVSQQATGKFETPAWDAASQKKIRDALLVLSSTMPDFRKAFGTRETVDPVRRLIGTAAAWGGNPDKDAVYLNITPAKNDGKTVYRLNVKDVPVDAFWSVSVYNAAGYFQKNPANAYTVNNLTAKKSSDGAIAIQFGGCDGQVPNCLPVVEGWNYTVRLYRPRAEVLSGAWNFPQPQPVN